MLTRMLLHGPAAFSSGTSINGSWVDVSDGPGRFVGLQFLLSVYTSGTFTVKVIGSPDQTNLLELATSGTISAGPGATTIVNAANVAGISDCLKYARMNILPTVGTAAGTITVWACFSR